MSSSNLVKVPIHFEPLCCRPLIFKTQVKHDGNIDSSPPLSEQNAASFAEGPPFCRFKNGLAERGGLLVQGVAAEGVVCQLPGGGQPGQGALPSPPHGRSQRLVVS